MQEKAIIKWEDNRLTEIKICLDDRIISSWHYISIESAWWESKYVFFWFSKEEREELLYIFTKFRDNISWFLSKDFKNL